jgi:hypothetical protein
LLVFERQVLRRYGLVGPEEEQRIRNDDELEKLIRGEVIVKYTTIQRIK